MPKPIHALPLCAPALLAAQLFGAAVEVQACTSDTTATSVTTARTTLCRVTDNQTLTVTSTGSITTTSGNSIQAGSNTNIINRGNITATNASDGAIYIGGARGGRGNTLTNTGNITTTTGSGIGSLGAGSSFNILTNRVSTGATGATGRITGSTDGIRVGFINNLTNDAGALIRGTSGAGVALIDGGTANVTNSGTIQGGTYGLDYRGVTIRQLTNNNGGRIQGGTQAAVRAGAITQLDNNSGGRIVSTSNDGVQSTGAIGTLNNSGTISGGRHGVSALTVNLDNSGDITGGTSSATTNGHALNLGAGNSAIVNTGNLTSAKGRGINGTTATVLTALSNSVDPLKSGSGVIEGSTDGVSVGFIERLVNNARAVIEGKNGAGIVLTRTTAGTASVDNSGTIKGRTFGLDYDGHTISTLTNSGTIQGGSQAGVRATTITRLVNEATGKIVSTDSGGVQSTGVIGTLAIGTL